MSELPSNGDADLPPSVTPAMIEEHCGGEDGEECGTCQETVSPCDIEQICCTCSADRERGIKHQQWLLDVHRTNAKAARDILQSLKGDWFEVHAATQLAIVFLEFADGSKAPETTAGDVLAGLRGQAATPPGVKA